MRKKAAVPLNVSDEDFERAAKSQRDLFNRLADQVERGEPVSDPVDKALISGVLRAWAKQIPAKQKRGRGAPSSFPRGDAALLVAAHWHQEGTREKAVAYVADLYDVPPETVLSAFREYRDALDWLVPKG